MRKLTAEEIDSAMSRLLKAHALLSVGLAAARMSTQVSHETGGSNALAVDLEYFLWAIEDQLDYPMEILMNLQAGNVMCRAEA